MTEFAKKVSSIGTSFTKGEKREKVVRHEKDGSVAGKHVEHWDGRVDAVAMPKPVHLKPRINEEG